VTEAVEEVTPEAPAADAETPEPAAEEAPVADAAPEPQPEAAEPAPEPEAAAEPEPAPEAAAEPAAEEAAPEAAAASRKRAVFGGSTGGFDKWRMVDSPPSSGQSRPSASRPQPWRPHLADDHSHRPNRGAGTGLREPDPPPRATVAPRRTRPRLNKYRLALVLAGLSILAAVSTVFGMMMAVAQDLPELEAQNEFKAARNSVLVDDRGRNLATLTGQENRILLRGSQISSNVKRAVIAVEDQRFYEHKGVDYKGIMRAIWEDLRRQRAAQGGSTITQQFVKNALVAQKNRSVFQKLREAALAYQLERKWSKEKILTEYLNTVYFGEGAYGIESAARVFFGWNHPGCEPECASELEPAEAAMLAGQIASPAAYSPIQNPASALARRNLVLDRMQEQGFMTTSEYRDAVRQSLPPRSEIVAPRKVSKAPYFTSWVEDQLVRRYGTGNTFGGGLKIRTTLDLDLQKAAEQAISGRLTGVGPSAALVAIDNDTGGIRAMVGGADFEEKPFNLATQGRRQPGSVFKPFTLVAALEEGVSPGHTFVSAPKQLEGPRGVFKVENYEDRYSGAISLAGATTVSDNSVYAEVGYKLVGTSKVAKAAKSMGVRTPISRNPAMVLGGLKQGVTPLEIAQSYGTIAEGGKRITGSFAAYKDGPVAFTKVEGPGIDDKNDVKRKRVVPDGAAQQTVQILQSVVTSGTGRAANIGEFAAGKTGTTENYQDAWFVGFNDELTVAVWVGYPDSARPMETEYRGEPVAGGTYPAEIWRDFMLSFRKIADARAEPDDDEDETTPVPGPVPVLPPADTPQSDDGDGSSERKRDRSDTPSTDGGGTGGGETPAEPAPAEPTPAPEPTPDPTGGGGTGGGTGTPPSGDADGATGGEP
jgi:penicillin-binding protein 1A